MSRLREGLGVSRIVAMTNLEPLEALTGAAAEYVAAVDAYFANQPAEGYEDDTQYASAIDRAEQALRQRQGGTSATSALATFAPLIDEVRRLRDEQDELTEGFNILVADAKRTTDDMRHALRCRECDGSGIYLEQHDYASEQLGCNECQGTGLITADQIAELQAEVRRLRVVEAAARAYMATYTGEYKLGEPSRTLNALRDALGGDGG